jgi:hypothetical protein
MKDMRHEIAAKSAMQTSSNLRPHAPYDLFKSLEEGVRDYINDRVWFGVYEFVRGHTGFNPT